MKRYGPSWGTWRDWGGQRPNSFRNMKSPKEEKQPDEERAAVSSVNKVYLIGNVGKGWELKYMQGGKPFCTFTLATNEEWTDGQGRRQKKTEWHRIVTWNKLAETCGKWLKMGKPLWIEGRLTYKKWLDQTGREQYRSEIEAFDVKFLDPGSDGIHGRRANDDQISFKHRNAE
jgi:single-strand DNA-binding protein